MLVDILKFYSVTFSVEIDICDRICLKGSFIPIELTIYYLQCAEAMNLKFTQSSAATYGKEW